MKLNAAQVEQTMNQFEAEVIPDDHPLASELKELFGDHTYVLSRQQRTECGGAERAYRRGHSGRYSGNSC
jgi:hypothetical protein